MPLSFRRYGISHKIIIRRIFDYY